MDDNTNEWPSEDLRVFARSPSAIIVLALLTCLPAAGCVPLPYFSPPVRITTSGAIAVDDPLHTDRSTESAPVFSFRGGFHPQQLFGNPLERWYDLGAGYGFEKLFARENEKRHGPYIEAGFRVWESTLRERSQMRFLCLGVGELLILNTDHESIVGTGATIGFNFEIAVITESMFSTLDDEGEPVVVEPACGYGDPGCADQTEPWGYEPYEDEEETESDIIGVAIGEAAIGLYTAASYRNVGDAEHWIIHGGLTFRLPASAGILILWL